MAPTLPEILPRTRKLTTFLSHPYVRCITTPLLIYHLCIYLYLGVQAEKQAFYTSVVYTFNYGAVSVAYWIICRQNQSVHTMTEASNIISNEVFKNLSPVCRCSSFWRRPGCICFSVNFLLREKSMHFLDPPASQSYQEYVRYCQWWEGRILWICGFWMGCTTINIVLKVLPDSIIRLPPSFDSDALAFYGYYNLSGQYIASVVIVTAGVTMLTAFYQLRFIVIQYTSHIRSSYYAADTAPADDQLIKAERTRYLDIQKLSLAMSALWSTPVVVTLFFCTQVVISNLVVIHYTLTNCRRAKDCGLYMAYPVIWLIVGLGIAAIILRNIAQINLVAQTVHKIFVYAQNGCDARQNYRKIGGRNSWLEYLETNVLEFSISGIVITPSLVVNAVYTIATGIASFLISELLGGDE